eukprot:CAMPEP_0167740514 /NCGR_PEP_ID=MMETSP0110_2-20121227/322_1 /TAXON_ID=629695 /ORGANISM="Gymnochlora sp., Strain CCMP2014" /LENGTH=927 /DNA_ID=CAMNT_0007624421 /DNA_START=56 /DNA_END=2836 /DNA_ORIENTATION=-
MSSSVHSSSAGDTKGDTGDTSVSSSGAANLGSNSSKGRDRCSHYTSIPAGWENSEEKKKRDLAYDPNRAPVRKWPFTLDDFQKEAIQCVEKGDNVMVAAHTSAGKTVVAEYAIALGQQKNARTLYTTPIKALSNQKFREFSEDFKDVGLMTGDITINPNANVLILTTEILRNMLYRGSEILREVRYVVFDEVHYMRDRTRGVVWEESIILLPKSVTLIFLSATLSNANEFCDWIAHIKESPCHVIMTEFRPTPLVHYVFPTGGDGLRLVVDKEGKFNGRNFDLAVSHFARQMDRDNAIRSYRERGEVQSDTQKIVKVIKERDWLPAIVFCFSRRGCEGLAIEIAKTNFNIKEEQKAVEEVFQNAILSLSEEDQELQEIKRMLPILMRGVAVHHSGLIPILKEIVEILFSEGFIKVLVATETFAMGVNMPARTAIFHKINKFDGQSVRALTSGEYIQMSGRAGRRNKDKQGICIMILDDQIDKEECKTILTGKPTPLVSTFRLTYNMLLNLLRIETVNAESIIMGSFHIFQHSVSKPEMEQALKKIERAQKALEGKVDTEVDNYLQLLSQKAKLEEDIWQFSLSNVNIASFLQPGRLVFVEEPRGRSLPKLTWGWGVVVDFRRKYKKADGIIVYVLLNCKGIHDLSSIKFPIHPEEKASNSKNENSKVYVDNKPLVVGVMISMVTKISAIRMYMPTDLSTHDQRRQLMFHMNEAIRNFPDRRPPILDAIKDLQPNILLIDEQCSKLNSIKNRLAQNKTHSLLPSIREAKLKDARERQKLLEKTRILKAKYHKSGMQEFKVEISKRMRVLHRLGFVDENGVIQSKGKFACELESVDELVTTELIFGGALTELTPAQLVAFLTCCYSEMERKMEALQNPPSQPKLASAWQQLTVVARRVAKVQKDAGLEIDEAKYVNSFSQQEVDVTLAW